MLSEDKIKKMIRLSEYEKGKGKADLRSVEYTHTDYIRKEVIRTVIAVLIASIMAVIIGIGYHFEYIINNATTLDWKVLLFGILAVVIVTEVLMVSITIVMYNKKYTKAKFFVSEYYITLNELLELYESEEEGEKSNVNDDAFDS